MKLTWIAEVFAAVAPAFIEGAVSTFSQTGCLTRQSTKSTSKIPTSTRSATLTFKPKVTVVTTSTKTIIPTSNTFMETFYAACGSDNRVSSVNGRGISDGNVFNNVVAAQAASAYDCCVLCLQTENCGATYFGAQYNNLCAIITTAGTCSATTQVSELVINDRPGAFVVSNSNCGRLGYTGA